MNSLRQLSLLILSFMALPVTIAQTKTFAKIPESKTHSITDFSAYIRENYPTPDQRVGAIYQWITHHISYDVNLIHSNPYTFNNSSFAS